MATVVLTVVGTAFGGPIGGLIGGIVGRQVDQKIFGGGSRTIEGGRLKDLTVQTSAYGEPISRIYGTMRVPGNVVWSSGLKESRSEKTEGGGGKGGGQKVTTVTFTYSASFAVALSGREISDVGQIWADGKLLRNSAGSLSVGGKIRIYQGTDFQVADPLIEALEGQGNVNGFRNLAYVVFEDLELAEYANRIPNLTFEVIADTGGEIALSSLVSDICAQSRVPSYDASDLSQMVGGYMIPGPMKSRNALEELAQIYHFDVIEQADSLLFRKLDRGVDMAIISDDITRRRASEDPTDKIILTRQQELELPREIGLSFIDPDRDYQTGHQRARRQNVASDIVRQNAFPLVITSDMAKSTSEIQLDLAWHGREVVRFSLPDKYADLAPGDILTLSFDSGPQDFMLREVEIGLEGVSCQAVKFSRSILNRISFADSGAVPVQQVTPLASSALFLMDMATITGENIAAPSLFWSVAAGPGKWPGAGLFISRDNDVSYAQIDFSLADAVSGVVDNMLGAGPATYWDEGNDMLVSLDNAAHNLSGESEDAVLNGANVAWVGGEIIQFRQVVLELDGRYRLSGLLRGRRGTERMISGHGAAEKFILLTGGTVNAAGLNFSDIGKAHYFKVVTSGADVDLAPSEIHNFTADILKPFSPVHGVGVRDGAGNITLGWMRRSRVGGDWLDNADIPLGELYEKYDIEILSGTAVVRTQTSDMANVTYSAAAQMADFGALQATVDVRIMQISDNVGRGWPLVITV